MLKTTRDFIKVLLLVDALAFPDEKYKEHKIQLIVGDRKREPIACDEDGVIRIREWCFARYISKLRKKLHMSQREVFINVAIHEIRHKLQNKNVGFKLWSETNIDQLSSLVGIPLRVHFSAKNGTPKEIDACVIAVLCTYFVKGRSLKIIKWILVSQPEE